MIESIEKSFNFVHYKKNNLEIIAQSEKFISLINVIKERFDVDHIAWWQLTDSGMNCFSTFPKKWVCTYFQHDYERDDIVLEKTKNSLKPFLWNKYSAYGCTPHQEDMMIHAAEHGLKTGITFPINLHKRTAITFTSESHKNSFDRRGSDFIALSYIVSNLIETICQGQENDVSFDITNEVLNFILEQREHTLYDIRTSIRTLKIGLFDAKNSMPSRYWLGFQSYLSETINKLQSLL